MSEMSFLLPSGLSPDARRDLERAYVAGGPDTMPWPTEALVEPERLVVRRAADESGSLVVPWPVDGGGVLSGGTATLMDRAAPYLLAVELARGKVNQLRAQAADWRAGGLQVPGELLQRVAEVSTLFGRAATRAPDEEANRLAQEVITRAYGVAHDLVQVYLEQVFHIRHQRQPRLDTAFGCRLGSDVPDGPTAAALRAACNSVCVPFAWHVAEPTRDTYRWDAHDALLDWAEGQGLNVSAGPLVDFSSACLPEWLWHHERDLSMIARFMCRYVEQAVRRYRGRVRRWQLTAASNCADILSLGEDELLLLTVRVAEAARHADPSAELVIGIAQPWGEALARADRNHSPFLFADMLIRSGLTLAAIDVELVMGVTPRGSSCRDLLDTSRLLDLYALLGVPLRVTLGTPSARGGDPLADPDLRVAAGHWRGGVSPESQADWAASFAALAVAKPYVQGVHWCDPSDARPHQFPHAGLIDAAGQAKPVLRRLCELREAHLDAGPPA